MEKDIPEDMLDSVAKYKQDLLESVANADEAIGEMYIGENKAKTSENSY